jgi:DNA-binding CsgD family transcriptional regulator
LGWDAISRKAARATTPFTFAEVGQEIKSGRGSWIFEFLRSFDIVDGLFCPLGRWSLVYHSPRLLALSPATRWQLIDAAHVAVGRMDMLVKTKGREPSIKPLLTAREAEVLQERSRLHTSIAVARELNISKKTVDELLQRARRKLGAPNIAIALLEAYKRGLITY